MPQYCTQQDIEDRYGSDALLLIADRDNDGTVDAQAVSDAIDDASAEIDVYVGEAHDLPLPTVPSALVRVCVDITVYRLSATADIGTEEKRQRYEDAIALLKQIAKGEISLGLTDPPTPTNGAVNISGPDRQFTRRKMGNVL